MKTILKLLVALLISISSFAQNGINYKALIKDDSGNIVASSSVEIKFKILESDVLTNVYEETHSPTTDNNGIIIVNIGEGTVVSGIFDNINWGNDDHFLNIKIDTGSGFINLGTTQFSAVPYAFHAKKAANVKGLEAIDEGNGIGWRLIGRNNNYGNIGSNAIDFSFINDPTLGLGATGSYAFSLGYNGTASGEHALAFGNQNYSLNDYAISLGNNNVVSGLNSTAIGGINQVSGDYAFAEGLNNEASGDYAFTAGIGNVASDYSTFAQGYNTTASGYCSTAMGENTAASGDRSFAIGFGTIASHHYSSALGFSSTASGYGSAAIGFNTTASGDYGALAIGFGTLALGNSSTAMGSQTKVEAYAATAIGKFNVAGGDPIYWIESDPIFEIGNGTLHTDRSNALTVLKNGNVGIGTHTPQELLHISGGRLRIGSETIEDTGNNRLSFNADLLPDVDNAMQLGNANFHWTGVWATDGTINTSDRREKKNINTLNYGLNEVLKMQPVSFNWKNRTDQGTKLGLIAQDLLKLIPEVVKTHDWEKDEISGVLTKKELDRLGVYYSDLVPVLIKAIQEQQEIIGNQNTKIEGLTSELTELARMNTRIKALEQQLKTAEQ